ncbi:MAG: cobyric acid synthase [Nitrososphaeraceae archaeon]|jgi:adenosylcobyric acid synthase|nr:cobyric acid synthase [Nitrososphaeraceae archaeon]MDW3611487.1 cobyric acid synthase [Nitrososphaeraceae archaeon]
MNAKVVMVQGTSSGAGKSTIVIALCRIFSNMGYKVSPFKAQNMSSKIHIISNVHRISKIQAIQAFAARKELEWQINPILLVPLGNNKSNVFVAGKFLEEMSAIKYYQEFVLAKGFPIVLDAVNKLKNENDIIIIEGAGSPAEINIAKYDIANMLLAETINSPVILVSDIERGGCFASIFGTIKLLKIKHQRLIKGFIINKFRGDENILEEGIRFIEYRTKVNNIGIIPKFEFFLPPEDSLDGTNNDNLKNLKKFSSKKKMNEQIDLLAATIGSRINVDFILQHVLKIG